MGLELIEAFVNSVDLEDGKESWDSPAALKAWLTQRRLMPAGAAVGAEDLRRAIRLRESLRIAAAANNPDPGHSPALPSRTRSALNEISDGLRLRVAYRAGGAALEPAGFGVDAALARIVAAVYEAMLSGSWARLKACANPGCRWAFYDASKNRSGRWCEMADCGNDAKGRAFRDRRRKLVSA
jgi:predicted RNA-binding Zn ribbon-like protein